MPLISLMDTKQPGVNPGFICTHQKIGVVLILLFPLKLLLILLTLPNWSRHVFILVALACSYAGAYTVEHCRSACLMMNGTGDVPFSSKKITNNTIMTPSTRDARSLIGDLNDPPAQSAITYYMGFRWPPADRW